MKIYTAWDLAGDWWWINNYEAKTLKGRVLYEEVTAALRGNGKTVILSRLDGLRTIRRYVHPDTKLILQKIK